MVAPLAHLPHADAGTPAHPGDTGDVGCRAALAQSEWAGGVPGLDAFAAELFDAGAARRREASEHADRILAANPTRDVSRAVTVGFEMFVQSIALALDMRDVARLEGVPLTEWLRERARTLRGSGTRLLAGAFDEASRGTAGTDGADTDASKAMLARRLRITAEALGPTFVKFGQILGSSAGLAPPELVHEFARCRDEVRPDRPSAIRRVVEAELGPIASQFASFDPTPIASASIAQVHAARLRNGREVVVKVQRPGVRRLMERDAALLYRCARAIDGVELMETANMPGMVELFANCLVEELDFRLEAENMVEFALALERAGADIAVPRPIPGMVTERALVMERLDGRPIDAGGADSLPVFKIGTQAVLDTAITYGLFHADLHAGNILALRDGRFGLVDFGIVGRFDEAQRRGLGRWLLSFAGDDLEAQLAALDDLGAFPADIDLTTAHDQIDTVITRVAAFESPNIEEISSHFELIARILMHHGMRLPKELALFFKNLIHVSGAVRAMSPDRPGDEMSELVAGIDIRDH